MTTKSLDEKDWSTGHAGSAALFKRARNVLPGGNTRTTVFFPPFPLYAAEGQGAWLTDVEGVRRLDVFNNATSMIHGHCHPFILERAIRQLQKLGAVGMPTEPEIELAELLQSRMPSLERIRFTNSGTEAVMTAIRGARAATGRPKIAKCEGCYHGSYDFAEISQAPAPHEWGVGRPRAVSPTPGTPPAVADNVIVLPFNQCEPAAAILEEHARELACVIVDPVPGHAGSVPMSPEYLAMLRQVTGRHDILLVFDEVVAFRLGYGGAQGRWGVRPDLTTLGKAIGGGFPIGAVGGQEEVMRVFDPGRGSPRLGHGGTFNANPVTMATGIAAVSLLTRERIDLLEQGGERVRAAIAASLNRHGLRGTVTGCSSLIHLHFHEGVQDYRSSLPGETESLARAAMFHRLLRDGVFASPRTSINLSTPMTEPDLDFLVEALDRALAMVAEDFPALTEALQQQNTERPSKE